MELPIKLLRSAMLKPDGLFINSDTFFNSNIELSGTMNFYTATKSELRAILSEGEFASKYRIVNAILYQMFGLDDDDSKFVPTVIKKIVEGEQKIPMTPGLQTRDFISVESVADIYMRLLKRVSALVGFSQLEVGNGLQTSVKEFRRCKKISILVMRRLTLGSFLIEKMRSCIHLLIPLALRIWVIYQRQISMRFSGNI